MLGGQRADRGGAKVPDRSTRSCRRSEVRSKVARTFLEPECSPTSSGTASKGMALTSEMFDVREPEQCSREPWRRTARSTSAAPAVSETASVHHAGHGKIRGAGKEELAEAGGRWSLEVTTAAESCVVGERTCEVASEQLVATPRYLADSTRPCRVSEV